jgi:23S rRNA pseudouridine955/2504/2580 synthase
VNSPEQPNPEKAVLIEIDDRHQFQRLDNFLVSQCKGVPKSHVFRIIRSGEVRVNGKRAEAKTKLDLGDVVRIPPIRTAVRKETQHEETLGGQEIHARMVRAALQIPVVFEDAHLLVLNKPSGMAVHGGSGSSFGVIECLRAQRADTHEDLELVHRIDRETSGILIVSKKRSALRRLQEQLRERSWKKFYQTLVCGAWPDGLRQVDFPLLKTKASEKEAKVFVSEEGDKALTKFSVLQRFRKENLSFTLIRAQILTGRTHQIRVHTSASHFPIVGDDRYGNFELNKSLVKWGLKRMFLHAAQVIIVHPATGEELVLHAPLAIELDQFLKTLQTA